MALDAKQPARGQGLFNGVHAVLEYAQVERLLWDYASERRMCFGAVYLWGRIVEHTYGFRAAHAYPAALYVADSTDPVEVMELERRYGVPVQYSDLFTRGGPIKAAVRGVLAQMQEAGLFFFDNRWRGHVILLCGCRYSYENLCRLGAQLDARKPLPGWLTHRPNHTRFLQLLVHDYEDARWRCLQDATKTLECLLETYHGFETLAQGEKQKQ